MIEVEQTICVPPKGDCLRACVASIFELPIDQVPNFIEASNFKKAADGEWHGDPTNGWWDALVSWSQDRGYTVLDVPYLHGVTVGPYNGEPVPVIAVVPSPRGCYNHCIIACIVTGEILWDPFPKDKMTGVIPEDTAWWKMFVRGIR